MVLWLLPLFLDTWAPAPGHATLAPAPISWHLDTFIVPWLLSSFFVKFLYLIIADSLGTYRPLTSWILPLFQDCFSTGLAH